MPEKRDGASRSEDFHEIYREFAAAKAKEQASRCSQCGVPYCQSIAAAQQHPRLAAPDRRGRTQEAYLRSQETNTFPEICGRICPQDRLCEGNCVIEQSGHGTVTIGAIEKYITDTGGKAGSSPSPRRPTRPDPSASSAGSGRAGRRRPAAPHGLSGHRL